MRDESGPLRAATRFLLCVGSASALLALSCSSGAGSSLAKAYNKREIKHEYSMAPGDAFHAGLKSAAVLPINAIVERPTGLDVADATLTELVESELTARGVAVTWVDIREFTRAQDIAVRSARKKMMSATSGKMSTEVTPETFLPELMTALEVEADLIVVPAVVMRSGTYSAGRVVRWDGVKRRERGTANVRMDDGGGLPTASMLTIIHGADGRQLFMGYGGLDLIFELNVPKRRYDLREDRLSDEENLAEGVCVSFHPFFGTDVDC